MSELTTVDPKNPTGWRRLLRGRFLVVSVLFHLLLAVVATYFVVQTFIPRKQTFQSGPTATDPSRKSVEHQVQMAKKQKTMSAPAPAKRITTTGLSKVALPEMPEMPTTSAPGKMQGMGAPGAGIGAGTAGAGSNAGAAGLAIPFFGVQTGLGLAGTFYDLKQSRSGKPNELAIGEGDEGKYMSSKEKGLNNVYSGIVAKLIDRGMSEAGLGKYFAGPKPLYTTQIYIPAMDANEAPKAFQLAEKVQPRRWIIIYRGKVIAPEDGRYSFVGGADDVIAVRFNGRIVFSNREASKKNYNFDGMGGSVLACAVGPQFEVKAGKPYDIQIAIGEQPGGSFKAYLLLEKEGADYRKDSKGNPILPIFKLAPSNTKQAKEAPVIAPDTSWSVWKATQTGSLLPPGLGGQ